MAKIEKIKLRNFKSFKKVDLPIASGYTVIIGANGSGKSNIIDGIVFALGTGSMKHLRAEKVSDLVYEGSKEGVGSVELDFRDNGGEKVSIARLIDKKGQSVFKLNGRRTTRFQINEVLGKMSVVPDGHNIIMQGEVTRFIKLSPMQRRGYIDEVSGIAEYESKKEESLRELEKVEQKLKEASLILGEKEGYLNQLEKEKIEAEVYMKLKKELNSYEATLVKKDLTSIEKTYENLMKSIVELKEKISKLEKQKEEKKKQVQEYEQKIDDVGREILEESDKRQLEVRKQIEEVKASIAILEEKMRSSKEATEKNNAKAEELNKEISSIGREVKEKEKELDVLNDEEDDLLKKQHELQRELEKYLKEVGSKIDLNKSLGKVEELNSKIDEKRGKIYSIKAETKSLEERINLKKALLEGKKKELRNLKGKGNEVESKLKELEKKKKELEKKLSETKNKLSILFEEEKRSNERLSQIEVNLSKGQKELRRLSERVAVLKREGVLNKAATSVLKAKELKGILGTVGDLITYDSKYARAVEAAGGNRLFFIVTETAEDATEAVKYLKKNKLGRATFIPLDKIKPVKKTKQSIEALKKPGALKHVIDLVKFNSRLRNVFEFVFGDTIAVEDVDCFKSIGIGRVRMVTLEGDLAEVSGLVRGGFSKNSVSSNDLKLLSKLEENVDNLEEEKKIVLKNLNEIREKVNELRGKRSDLELGLKEAEVMASEWRERLSEFSSSEERGGLSSLEKEVEEMQLELGEKKRLLEKLSPELDKMLEEKIKLKDSLGSVVVEQPKEIDELQKKVQEAKDSLGELKIKRSSLLNEIEKVLNEKRKNLSKQVKELEKENEALEEKLKELVSERNGLIDVLKKKEEKARELASSMTGLYKKKEKMEKEQRSLLNEIGGMNREIDVLKEKRNEKEVEVAKIESKLFELRKKWEKLKEVEVKEKMSFKQLNEKIDALNKQLENIGNVNMKAIELYDKYYSEIGEIVEKKKTLSSEKEKILKMIEEIDKHKLEVFMEAFNSLNKTFDKYFKLLYPEKGSKASIHLEKPENPFEGGLLLKASPFGKPVKSIDLLSGGEKSLTAIAFIFAIQEYKPSPFYVLDEVDAALDADNSNRIAKMMKTASKEIQMIIVTHNKNILQNADQIIGVHRAKDNSSVVEVDLSKYSSTKLKVSKTGRNVL